MSPSRSGYPVPKAKLQVGNGYNLEFDQLSILISAVKQDTRARIPQSDLALMVGVAERKGENLGSLANALGLLQKVTYKLTQLGLLIGSKDPYFDNLGTLWFLHYSISSQPRHIIWNRAINNFIPQQPRFTRDQLRASFDDLRNWFSLKTLRDHVSQEITTFLDAYIQQAFSRISYLRLDGEVYSLSFRQPIHPLVLAASTARFRDTQRPGATAIPIPDLCAAPNSPGVIFQLSAERIRQLLEELKTQPGFSLESRADLDQVRMSADLDDVTWMSRYYASR